MKKIFKTQTLTGFLLLNSVGLLHGGEMLRRAQEYAGSVEKDTISVSSEEIMRLDANRLAFSCINQAFIDRDLTQLDRQVPARPVYGVAYIDSILIPKLNHHIESEGFLSLKHPLPSKFRDMFDEYCLPAKNDFTGFIQKYVTSKLGYLYVKKNDKENQKALNYCLNILPKLIVSDLESGVGLSLLADVRIEDDIKNKVRKSLLEKLNDSGDRCLRLKVGNLPSWLSEFKNYTDVIVQDRMLADFVASQRDCYVYALNQDALQLEFEKKRIAELIQVSAKITDIVNNSQPLHPDIQYVLINRHDLFNNMIDIHTIFRTNPDLTLVVYNDSQTLPDNFKVPYSVKKLSIVGRNTVKVGNYFLSGVQDLLELDLPASLTSAGDYCLSYNRLVRLRLPSQPTKVGKGFFLDCKNLEKLHVPSGWQ
ncbi:MAG: leucine-rich repeat protein [Candidatus Dependentiae bacterium]|nr:leucine-rich repeat protein [Candidatus Dependentiae bacterium]